MANLETIKQNINRGEYQQAEELLSQYKEKHKLDILNPEYYVLNSQVLEKRGSTDAYLSNILEGLNHYPNSKILSKYYINHCSRHHLHYLTQDAIQESKATFPDDRFFYQRELEFYRRLTDFETLDIACNGYLKKFPKDPFGIFHKIETLILLKRKDEAEVLYQEQKELLPSKLKLRYFYQFNQYLTIEKICDSELISSSEYLYWLAEKLRVSLILNRRKEDIDRLYTELINHPNFSKNHYGLLLMSAFVDKKIEDTLIKLVDNSAMSPQHGVRKYVEASKQASAIPEKSINPNTDQKIDLVYTWVDMSDQNFREKFKKVNGFTLMLVKINRKIIYVMLVMEK